MPKSRINQWLLLIIRSMIILLLIVLFSRPILHIGSGSDAGEENAMAIVLIVDSSYSMRGMVNGQTIFSRARKTAIDIIENLQPSDRAAVLLFSDELENPSPALIADKRALTDILTGASPGYRITDAPAAFGMAFDMLSQSVVINKGIIFLTDSAAHAWKHDAEKYSRSLEKYDDRVGIIIIDCGLPADNIFIEDVDIPVVLAGDDAHLTWRIFNPMQTRVTQKEMSLMIGEKRVANRGMVLSAGKSSQGVLPFLASKSGTFPATLSISPDILMEDNLFYFYTTARRKLSVLCVDGDPAMGTVSGETYFARLALGEAGASSTSGVRLHVINQDQLDKADIADFQVVLLCNVGKLPGDFKKSIESFLHKGGGLGIFPGDNVEIDTYREIEEFLPVDWSRLMDVKDNPVYVRQDESRNNNFIISSGDQLFEFDKIIVDRYFTLHEKEGSRVVFRLSSHDPFLVVSDVMTGKVAVCAVPLDRDWSNLPAKPLYAPLLKSTVRYCGGLSGYASAQQFRIGEKIRMQLSSGNIRIKTVADASGTEMPFLQTGKRLVIEPILKPGHYSINYIEHSKKDSLFFSVNVDRDAEEGILKKTEQSAVKKYFPESEATFLTNNLSVLDNLMAALRGREVSRALIGFLILLLLLELWVGRKKKIKN